MSTREVADVLKLSTRQVARLVPTKLRPAAQAPGARGAYFFNAEDVTALAESRRSDVEALLQGRRAS